MNLRNVLLVLLAAALAAAGWSAPAQSASAQDDDKKLAEQIKEASIGSDFFETLKPFRKVRGKREHTIQWWSAADASPGAGQATGDAEWIHENRAISQSIKGTWLGVPFQATLLFTFDNTLQRYVALWSDTLANRTLLFTGQPDPAGNLVNFTADTGDALTHQPVAIRCVMQLPDRNGEIKTEFYRTDTGGREYKFMEIVSKRRSMGAG